MTIKAVCVGGPKDGETLEFVEGRVLKVGFIGSEGTQEFKYKVHSFSPRDSDQVVWLAGDENFSAWEVLQELVESHKSHMMYLKYMKEY
jgi:hypothetical protein